jgi:hypothetical protein
MAPRMPLPTPSRGYTATSQERRRPPDHKKGAGTLHKPTISLMDAHLIGINSGAGRPPSAHPVRDLGGRLAIDGDSVDPDVRFGGLSGQITSRRPA